MNKVEFKKRILDFGNNLVDTYIPCSDGQLTTRVINSTCKYIVKTKISELDPILNLFADCNGEIDGNDFVEYMKEHMIGDSGIKINLRDYINNGSSLANIIPNRTLILTKQDLDVFLCSPKS